MTSCVAVRNEERESRDDDPFEQGRQAGAERRQCRHEVRIRPSVANLDVDPFAVDCVTEPKQEGGDGDAPKAICGPPLVAEDDKACHQCRRRNEQVADGPMEKRDSQVATRALGPLAQIL